MTNSDNFISRFKYHLGNSLSGWQFINKSAVGDCNDFAFTVAYHESGGWAQLLVNVLTFRMTFWLVKSPVNKFWPRHVALYCVGRGWIDSTNRSWRPTVTPHSRVIPLLFPWVMLRTLMGLVATIFFPRA